MATKHHTHAAVLKAYGFVLKHKETGPNPVHPKQLSTLKSTWQHKTLGKIVVDHLMHTFDAFTLQTPYGITSLQIGKHNVGLIAFLDKATMSAKDWHVTWQQSYLTKPPKAFQKIYHAAKIPAHKTFEAVLLKHGFKQASVSAEYESTCYAKEDTTAYVNSKENGVILYIEGSSQYFDEPKTLDAALGILPSKAQHKFWKPKPGENVITFLSDPVHVPEKIIPPPYNLATKYTHIEYGHVYTWQIEDKMFVSSQGKKIDPGKMQWMVNKGIVQADKLVTDEQVKSFAALSNTATLSAEELKKLSEMMNKAEASAKAWKAKKGKTQFFIDPAIPPAGASEAIHQILLNNGYKFVGYGNKTNYPKYKDVEAKTVYVTSSHITSSGAITNKWEYYPMGSSSLNPYGSSMGQGIEELDKVLKTPFEKPIVEHYEETSNVNQTTKKLFTPHCPELEDEPFLPANAKAKKLDTGETIGGTASSHVDILPGMKFTPVEISAISSYKGSGSHSIQQHALNLAKDDSKLGGHKLTDWVKAIDSAILKCRINKDLILFRGVSGHYAQLCVDSFIPGATVHAPKAFFGCSSHQSVSHGGFSGSDKLVFRIHVPKGTPAVAVQHITTSYSSENEILLPRQADFVINKMFSSGNKIYCDCSIQLESNFADKLSDVAATSKKV